MGQSGTVSPNTLGWFLCFHASSVSVLVGGRGSRWKSGWKSRFHLLPLLCCSHQCALLTTQVFQPSASFFLHFRQLLGKEEDGEHPLPRAPSAHVNYRTWHSCNELDILNGSVLRAWSLIAVRSVCPTKEIATWTTGNCCSCFLGGPGMSGNAGPSSPVVTPRWLTKASEMKGCFLA